MKRPFIWCFGILAVLGITAGAYIASQADNTINHFTISPTVKLPTHFTPEPVFFCNTAHQYGGLENMVATAPGNNYETTMLSLMTGDSPDAVTFTAMKSIYAGVLRHQHPSLQSDIQTVEGDQPCVTS